MLLQFNFKNFKSFREETTLDMTAANVSEMPEHTVVVGGEKVLMTAAIYGANASGKSNVYNAFSYMTDYVLRSFGFGGDERNFSLYRPTPFMLDDSSEKQESSFEVYFIIPGDRHEKTYNYGFSVDRNGVKEEWLNVQAKTARQSRRIFYRSEEELDLSGFPKTGQKNLKAALEKQALIVSLGAKLKIDICKKIWDWFADNELSDFANPVENYYLSTMLPEGFANDETVRQQVVNYFASFDDSIRGFEVEEVPVADDQNGNRYRILCLHKKTDSDEMARIPMQEESAGTLKMFALYPQLHRVLERGSVYFVDELNARLHPLLVRNFILIFLNQKTNPNHAQLIFTTHDTWQLSNHMLRRDEVWFTDKDGNGVTTLYSLADFVDESGLHIRKDADYEKNYLLGKYGAIPELRSIDIVREA